MGTCTQKMRCGSCGYSKESEDIKVAEATKWYEETAKNMRICPNCKKQTYALSAYNEDGLKQLQQKANKQKINGAWYCTIDGKLQQFSNK